VPHENPAAPLDLNEQGLQENTELQQQETYNANAAQIEGPSPKNGEARSLAAANGNANGVEDIQSSADGNSVPSELPCDDAPSPASNGNGAAAHGNNGRRYQGGVIALRLGLHANGYHPVPVTAPAPGDKSAGKKPVLDDWGIVCATADEATIRGWPRKWSNTGLVCGVSTEAGALVGVDIDVLDEELSQQIEQTAIQHLGPSPLRRVGLAPKVLLAYRIKEPLAKIATNELTLPSGKKAKVEILGKGQQFVAYGIHPDTRRNYEWGDASPVSMTLADLPMVTREALQNFIDLAGQLIIQAGGKVSQSAKRKSGKSRRSDKMRFERSEGEARPNREAPEWSEVEAGRIREALKYIPADDRKVWLDVGMALHSTGWGEPARMLWDEWSRTVPEKFDAKDQRRTWESFRSERSDGITLGTLFSLALQNGWAPTTEPYNEHDGSTWYNGTKGEMKVANFNARIVSDIALDDGSGLIRRRFEVRSERFGTASVPAEQFDSMNWVTLEYGAQARIGVGRECKARMADAIKALSRALKRTVYAHLGWRQIGDQWFYLHAGGAIGAFGPVEGIEVDPGRSLSEFRLPPVCDLRAAVLASLEMLNCAPRAVTWPLIGAVYLAPLSQFTPVTTSVFLAGPTGEQKTSLAMIAQAHWGNVARPPANWTSTASQLEGVAFVAKDALLVIDEFCPRGGTIDVQRLHAKADQILRGQANRTGRGRMYSDGSFRRELYPRGLILATGEDIPTGHSLRARMTVLEIDKGAVKLDVLSRLQGAAVAGTLAEAVAAYVAYVARQPKAAFAKRALELRAAATKDGGQHRRTPENIAQLMLGVETFLNFAVEAQAVTVEQRTALRDEAWNQLTNISAAQAAFHRDEQPASRFAALLAGVLSSGRAHIRHSATGKAPCTAPGAFGWARHEFSTKDDGGELHVKEYWREGGKQIGWLEGEDDLYLNPEAAYAAVLQLAREQEKPLGLTQKVLWTRLKEEGMLKTTDKDHNTVQKTFQGQRDRYLHVSANSVLGVLGPPF
jgi:hypothetical protein